MGFSKKSGCLTIPRIVTGRIWAAPPWPQSDNDDAFLAFAPRLHLVPWLPSSPLRFPPNVRLSLLVQISEFWPNLRVGCHAPPHSHIPYSTWSAGDGVRITLDNSTSPWRSQQGALLELVVRVLRTRVAPLRTREALTCCLWVTWSELPSCSPTTLATTNTAALHHGSIGGRSHSKSHLDSRILSQSIEICFLLLCTYPPSR